MRPGENNAFIIEGETEAAVAAHYLTEVGAEAALDLFEPPIEARKLGYLAFVGMRLKDAVGSGETTEHTIEDPGVTDTVAQMMMVASVPNLPIFKSPRLGRRHFLQERLSDFSKDRKALTEQ